MENSLILPKIEKLSLEDLNDEVHIIRGDLVGESHWSGNKVWKLYYNLQEAKGQNKKVILTFGGAYSNHIAATAYAAKISGLKSMAIIRGDELKGKPLNPTLSFATEMGMQFRFVSRKEYQSKEKCLSKLFTPEEIEQFYIVPEGGTNEHAIKGVKEVFSQLTDFEVICCAVGTGGTLAGISEALPQAKIFGFPVLKNPSLENEIKRWTTNTNYSLINDYHFGGYGKITSELIRFMLDFKQKFNIDLDAIYTAKMVFGALQEIKFGRISSNGKILLVHSGGLQGNLSEKVQKLLLKSKISN